LTDWRFLAGIFFMSGDFLLAYFINDWIFLTGIFLMSGDFLLGHFK
jgi:hypothetical protein